LYHLYTPIAGFVRRVDLANGQPWRFSSLTLDEVVSVSSNEPDFEPAYFRALSMINHDKSVALVWAQNTNNTWYLQTQKVPVRPVQAGEVVVTFHAGTLESARQHEARIFNTLSGATETRTVTTSTSGECSVSISMPWTGDVALQFQVLT
jgi:hypothetical protein